MRDLYTRLNVNKSASVSELERAIESCWDAKLKKDAATVLLNPQMREAYDQAHNVLCNIGNLRSNLGLSNSPNWTGAFVSDFYSPPSRTPSQLEIFKHKVKQNNQTNVSKSDDEEGFTQLAVNFLKAHPILTLIVILVGFALVRSVFEKDEIKPTYNAPQQNSARPAADRTQLKPGLPDEAPTLSGPLFADLPDEDQQRAENNQRPVTNMFGDLVLETSAPRFKPSESRIAPKSAKTLQLVFHEPEIARPKSGEAQNFSSASRVAPFEIKASQLGNYLVKLVDTRARNDVMTVFVRGGTTVEVEVPLGVFEVRYAYGEKWYGYKHLFGPDTVYSKAETTFDFSSDGNRVTGYTITLYGVRDGNLQTSKISAEEF